MPTLCLDGPPRSELSLAALTDKLVRSVSASIWEASLGMAGDIDGECRRLELVEAIRASLACSHPELVVREIATKKRAAGRPVARRQAEQQADVKLMRNWRPTRPTLALAAVKLLKSDEFVAQVPEKQREGCVLPFKIFASTLAHQLHECADASGASHSSVIHAVTEVLAAVFAEAEAIAFSQEPADAGLELHGSTDAAWRDTAARGAGIAMNSSARPVVVEASLPMSPLGLLRSCARRASRL
mgnify:CR=1 FL=1